MELRLGKKIPHNILQRSITTPKVSLSILGVSTLLLLATLRRYHPPLAAVSNRPPPPPPPPPTRHGGEEEVEGFSQECDIFTGEWVPNPVAPYYTNDTCWAIHNHQNCMKYGRPDRGFLRWRWKPDGCELPIFDARQFLDIVRGKSLAFVGDSVARNQVQSLICLLSKVDYPIDESYTKDESFKRWKYESYNFTLAMYWSPFLVKVKDSDGQSHPEPFNLYLDEFDEMWTTQIREFDYAIISAGHWFFRSSMYYENGHLVGCLDCQVPNTKKLSSSYGYQRAFRTAFKAMNNLENYKGVTFLRTFAPPHFEGGRWNEGGDCWRTKPLKSNETMLEGLHLDVYLTQVEEFNLAKKVGERKGLRYRLLDITQAMLLRPDGHPSRYGHEPQEEVIMPNDCLHWCLPGPIDSWSEFLLHMLKMES